MPRKTRSQPGTSGGNYANRTDKTQPVQAPTGLPYGESQELQQSQEAAPLPQAAPVDPWEQVMGAAQQMEFSPVGLNAPSTRPDEPVTAGLPSGPGPGPEAMRPQGGLSAQIQRAIATSGGSETLMRLLENARRAGL